MEERIDVEYKGYFYRTSKSTLDAEFASFIFGNMLIEMSISNGKFIPKSGSRYKIIGGTKVWEVMPKEELDSPVIIYERKDGYETVELDGEKYSLRPLNAYYIAIGDIVYDKRRGVKGEVIDYDISNHFTTSSIRVMFKDSNIEEEKALNFQSLTSTFDGKGFEKIDRQTSRKEISLFNLIKDI